MKRVLMTIGVLLITLFWGSMVLAHDEVSVDPAVQKAIPETPEQIRALRLRHDAIVKATESTPISVKQLSQTVKTINLSDRAAPPMLHLVSGYVTNIFFVGANGKPWPIESVVSGGDAISVNQSSKGDLYHSSILVNKPWVSTNVTYQLKGKIRPVTLYIYTAGDTRLGLDASVTVKVDGFAPGTKPLPVRNVAAVSDQLLNALDQAPGSNWQPVKLDQQNLPVDIRYWISPDHQKAIVRLTSGTLIMPNWSSQASSADNTTTAYEFEDIPLMLWIDSDDGQSFQVRVNDSTQFIAGSHMDVKRISDDAMTALSHMK